MITTALRISKLLPRGRVYQFVQRAFSANLDEVKFQDLSDNEFDRISEETLQGLCEYFDELPEKVSTSSDYDVSYSMGVLTVALGQPGTYVINKQSPNKQIWLSSPVSGPQRYDYVTNHKWFYKRLGLSLHELLEKEMSQIFGQETLNLKKLEEKSS